MARTTFDIRGDGHYMLSKVGQGFFKCIIVLTCDNQTLRLTLFLTRSFKCVPYEDFGCVSGPKSSSTVALSVQIRWQSSDLSLFETPPLPTGLPTTSRHSGWDPESSLTYPYTFPPNCSTVTDLWLPYDQKTCQPLTGDYYSPAICPSGWTAAFTRPVTAYGPPVEADETAMLCCPR